MYDVIVVGAGPGGSAAAKRCAEYGLNTLMLEECRLPRDKVCTGFIIGPLSQTLINQEFGELPDTVLTQPASLAGLMLHVPGIGSEKIDNFSPITWRRHLDYWMNQKAQTSGVEIWEGARVIGINQQGEGLSVVVENGKERQELQAKFVLGADGATSLVRSSLFPEFKARYGQTYSEHHRGGIDLDKEYCHWFYPLEIFPAVFYVHHRDGLVVLVIGGGIGQMEYLLTWAKDFLAKNFHFDFSHKPVWSGSCLEIIIFRELVSGTFKPARGNVLLVGEAGGLIFPVSREGIGLAIKTGLLAASSIKKAIDSSRQAEAIYLAEISPIISMIGEIYPKFRKMINEARTGGHSLPHLIRDGYQSTLIML